MSLFEESLANEILNEGVFALQKQDVLDAQTMKSKEAGNYLISLYQVALIATRGGIPKGLKV